MFELKNVGKTLSIRFCKITPNTSSRDHSLNVSAPISSKIKTGAEAMRSISSFKLLSWKWLPKLAIKEGTCRKTTLPPCRAIALATPARI